jgi:hypothetical protein
MRSIWSENRILNCTSLRQMFSEMNCAHFLVTPRFLRTKLTFALHATCYCRLVENFIQMLRLALGTWARWWLFTTRFPTTLFQFSGAIGGQSGHGSRSSLELSPSALYARPRVILLSQSCASASVRFSRYSGGIRGPFVWHRRQFRSMHLGQLGYAQMAPTGHEEPRQPAQRHAFWRARTLH